MKISAVYKITNTVTGDFYIGSSNDVKRRCAEHKRQSTWKRLSNNQLYQDMQKYGIENFVFEVLEVVEPEKLKEKEQYFIETLNPTYNQMNAKGLNIERRKESQKESQKKYEKSDKGKESHKKYQKKYDSQLCCYNGETLTLDALRTRFRRKGLSNPTIEAKKYLV